LTRTALYQSPTAEFGCRPMKEITTLFTMFHSV